MLQGLPQGCPDDDRRGWVSPVSSVSVEMVRALGTAVGRTAGWALGRCSAVPLVRVSRVAARPAPAARLVASSLG